MNKKRTTIYDLARELNISVSYVSKALNNHPSINEEMKEKVKKKAEELNYKHRFFPAISKRTVTKTIGVVIPNINKTFFSEAISGIEEVCIDQGYNIIACQSYDSYQKECVAIDTLIEQDVDCVIISVSAETESSDHLQIVQRKKIEIIQFDRYIEDFKTHRVINNNEEVSVDIVKHLTDQGYERIAFIGGPEQVSVYKSRKKGYLKGLSNASLPIVPDLIRHCGLAKEQAFEIAKSLLSGPEPPDAFMTISDTLSLGVHLAVQSLYMPPNKSIGIIGFTNEPFSELVQPPLSSVDQQSKELGRRSASLYFEIVNQKNLGINPEIREEIVEAKILYRESTRKKE